jgi:hypothetical protein
VFYVCGNTRIAALFESNRPVATQEDALLEHLLQGFCERYFLHIVADLCQIVGAMGLSCFAAAQHEKPNIGAFN